MAALLACAGPGRDPRGARIHSLGALSPSEQYCAWFGDARDGVLYFGLSAFWSALRELGGPMGDLRHEGPQLVGRFDLADERLLDSLDVGRPGSRAGSWDVLAHPNGRVYFTSYFEPAGWVEPASGAVVRLPGLGLGLNELALAREGQLAISRYPIPEGPPGSVLLVDEQGRLRAEHVLPAPRGYAAGPKTVAVDPVSGEIWTAVDLLPTEEAGLPIRREGYVLDAAGQLLRRFEVPELQFPAFGPDGTGYHAEARDGVLALRIAPPGSGASLSAGRHVVLDPAFPQALDFAQEVRPLPRGGVLVTRWSGLVHWVRPDGTLRTLSLPRAPGSSLYYTAVLHGDRICATRCADASVVCRDAPR